MAPTRELGPWTLHGDLAYPTVTTDRFLRDGDVIWVDAGITWEGYASDYGRTWITGADPVPDARQEAQFRRWRAVVDAALDVLKPGVSALELGSTAIDANGGVRPWIEHFYLAHGVGTESAEMPLIGTTWASDSTRGSSCSQGWCLSSSLHLGRRIRRLPLGRHCGRYRYGMDPTQRLNLRTVRIDGGVEA